MIPRSPIHTRSKSLNPPIDRRWHSDTPIPSTIQEGNTGGESSQSKGKYPERNVFEEENNPYETEQSPILLSRPFQFNNQQLAQDMGINTSNDALTWFLVLQQGTSLPIPKYDPSQNMTLREWLETYEWVTARNGLNEELKALTLPQYLSSEVEQWFNSLPNIEVNTWTRIWEALIQQYGLPEDEELDLIRLKFQKCTQGPTESVTAFSARFMAAYHAIGIREQPGQQKAIRQFKMKLQPYLWHKILVLEFINLWDAIDKACEVERMLKAYPEVQDKKYNKGYVNKSRVIEEKDGKPTFLTNLIPKIIQQW